MKNLRPKKQRKLIKYGDCFQIGSHLLACGDARDHNLVKRLIGNNRMRLICCDPPYGTRAVESKEGFSQLSVNKKILNDDIDTELEYIHFTKDWLIPIMPYIASKNAVYIFNSDKMIFALREGMKKARVKFAQLLIWIKNHSVIGRKDYLLTHELIAYGWHGKHEFRRAQDHSVLYYPKPNKSPLHPTQKPISLLRRLILNSTNINDIVYDCFAGSGSTAVACEQTKRRCIMIERDEHYCQIIINRFKCLFGIEAERKNI